MSNSKFPRNCVNIKMLSLISDQRMRWKKGHRMLWKKESNQANALYVDYFGRFESCELADLDAIYNQSKPPPKSNRISDLLRDEGNGEFAAENWLNAILAYNYALCFAEYGSQAMSQAYANRSAGFFELGQFHSSYHDINLCLQSSEAHSDTLWLQIGQHRRHCMDFFRELSTPTVIDQVPELNFDLNANIPTLIDVLKIGQSNESSDQITANCDIDVGQTIVVEKSPISKLMSDKYMRCNVCFTKAANLIPCEHCTGAMFCSKICQQSILHEAECNMNPINDDGKLELLVRSVSYAISLFSGIDQLMEFIEMCIASETDDLPWLMTDDRSKYRHFLRLKSDRAIVLTQKKDPLIYLAYKAITQSKTGQMFTSERTKRYLIHLIWQHEAIISLGHVHQHTNKMDQIECLSVSSIFSHFKHSCTPNAMYHLVRDRLAVISITPIKRGEPISISYFGRNAFTDSDNDRKQNLECLGQAFGTICKCDLCTKRKPTESERNVMANDPYFKYIDRWYCYNVKLGTWSLRYSKRTELNVKRLRHNAIEFLQKYGRSIWCKEIRKVAACLADVIWLESDPDNSTEAQVGHSNGSTSKHFQS